MQENKKSSNEKNEKEDGKNANVEMENVSVPKESPQEDKNKDQKVDKDIKPENVVHKTIIDKELLKAYRYFDCNRVGYIKVPEHLLFFQLYNIKLIV